MKCQQCNEHLSDDAVFCFYCGTAVSEPIILCSGKKKDGTPCGSRLQEGYKFCMKCGSPVNQGKQTLCKGVMKDGSACSDLLEEEAEFCSKCGTPQGAKPPVNQRKQTLCKGVMKDGSACSNLLEEKAEFCLNCGTTPGAKPSEEISLCAKSDAENGPDNINAHQDSALKFPVSSSPRLNEEIVEPSLYPLPQSRSTSESVTKNSLDGESQDTKRNVSSDDVYVSSDTEDVESKMNDVTLSDASGHDTETITADTGDKNTGDSEGDANTSDDSQSTKSVSMLDKKTTKVKSQKKPKYSCYKNKKMQGRKDASVRTNVNNRTKKFTKKCKALWMKTKSKKNQGKKKTQDISNSCCLESLKDIQESAQKLVEKIDEKTANNSQPSDTLEKGSIDHIHAVKEKVTIQETGNEINSDKDKSENTENGHAVDDERTDNQGKEIAPIQETRNGINSGITNKSENTGNGQVLSGKITCASALETQSNTLVKEQVKESMEPEVGNLKSEKETGRGPQQNSKNLNMQQKNKDDVACGKRPAKSFVQRNPDCILLHFHVLVSPDFQWKMGQHKIFIDIDWKNPEITSSYEMEHVMQVQGYEEMQMCILIKKQVLESGFKYIYAIYDQHNCKKKVEKYYKSDWTWTKYRSCLLPANLVQMNEYHQYDGIMNRYIRTWDRVKQLEEDAKISAEIFTQEKLLSTRYMVDKLDQETLNMLNMLLLGLEKIYLQDAKCWSSSQKEFKEKMAMAILSPILKSLESEIQTPLTGYTETQQQAERRMQVALFILTMIGHFKFPLSAQNRSLLAKFLLLRPHHQTGEFHDLAVITSLEKKRAHSIKIKFLLLFVSMAL